MKKTKTTREHLERDSVQELADYFKNMPAGKALDVPDEMLLLEHFPEAAVTSYFKRFRFSEKAEIVFIKKAPEGMRRHYLNLHGLRPETQKFVIDNNLIEVAQDFLLMHQFEDIDYLMDNGSGIIIGSYFREHTPRNEEQLLKLLNHPNKTLFKACVDKGYFISPQVQRLIIEERKLAAFNAIMFKFYRNLKKKARSMTWEQMQEKGVADVALEETLQHVVFDVGDRMLITTLLRTTPLAPSSQRLMFERNYDVQWFKLHVEQMYGMAGYRFEPEWEEKLFKLLAIHDLDECLTSFRHRDDVNFVRLASSKTVAKYLKDFWLSDAAQVVLVSRGDVDLMKVFISRFSPEHGMCWQAEVKFAEIYSPEVIRLYIEFHSMCAQALEILGKRSPETLEFYYTKHQY